MKMTDRKQEAIEIIAEGLPTKTNLSHNECLAYAAGIHDRIAPLMKGEFPKKEIKNVLAKLRPKGKSPLYQDCLDDLRHLWEGQEAKDTCKKCGGFRRISDLERAHPEDLDICPQCKGTGKERRSGEERRGRMPWDQEEVCKNCRFDGGQQCRRHAPMRGKEGYYKYPIIVETGLHWCGDFEFPNRRTEIRRK